MDIYWYLPFIQNEYIQAIKENFIKNNIEYLYILGVLTNELIRYNISEKNKEKLYISIFRNIIVPISMHELFSIIFQKLENLF